MPRRRRNIPLYVMVSPEELEQIHTRMDEAGVRKMALNGYILHVDLPPVRDLVALQRRCSNNINQVAIHANTYGVYPDEIAGFFHTRQPRAKLARRLTNCKGYCILDSIPISSPFMEKAYSTI